MHAHYCNNTCAYNILSTKLKKVDSLYVNLNSESFDNNELYILHALQSRMIEETDYVVKTSCNAACEFQYFLTIRKAIIVPWLIMSNMTHAHVCRFYPHLISQFIAS